MKLRSKTLIVIGLTLACLVLFLYVTSSTLLINGFSQVEKQDTRKNVQRAVEALSNDLSAINGVAGDWASWDETYSFIKDGDPLYVERNIYNKTFIEMRLNFMIFVNSSGGIVWERNFDLKNETITRVPDSLNEHLSMNSFLLQHSSPDSSIMGIVQLPEGTVLIVSRPILDNERIKPVRGSMIWGRYLDDEQVKRLGEITHLSLTVQQYNAMQMPPDFQAARNSISDDEPIFIQPLNERAVGGYTILKDIYGSPALLLRVDMPRDIYNQGTVGVRYLFFSLIVVGLIFGLISIWLLEKMVLSRLERLNSDVAGIGKSGDLSKHIVVEGKDELSSLAGAINTMTSELKTHRDHLEDLVEERTKELKTANEQLKQEITERIKVGEALKDSEERYRTIIEHSNDIIWTLDLEGRFMFINKRAEKVSGYKMEDWLGKSFASLINKEDIPNTIEVFHKTLSGEPQQYEVSVNRQDGSFFILAVNSAPLYFKEDIIGTVNFGRDITERKKVEEIQKKNERLAYESKAKSEFLANMSHELRTPLNSIIGFSELLKAMNTEGELSEKQERYVDNVITSGKFLLNLINDILDLSKVEAGKIELVKEKLSVPAVIGETLSLIKERASKHNIELKKELDPELEFIEADQQRIKQILFNLLSNAVKFSKDGGIVTVITKKEGNMAMISVSDTGLGIKEENIGKLFKEFEQLDSGISRSYGGTGLGLAISKKLVELHGGKISVESKYGESSTFTFSIPVSQKA
jgi:PAS domain S-box-containing protein